MVELDLDEFFDSLSADEKDTPPQLQTYAATDAPLPSTAARPPVVVPTSPPPATVSPRVVPASPHVVSMLSSNGPAHPSDSVAAVGSSPACPSPLSKTQASAASTPTTCAEPPSAVMSSAESQSSLVAGHNVESSSSKDDCSVQHRAPPPVCSGWLACVRTRVKAFYAMVPCEKTDAQIDAILEKFRYQTPELWAQLCMKYKAPVSYGLESLARTLHPAFPFELLTMDEARDMDHRLHTIQARDRAYLFNHFLGEDPDVVRQLSFRGVPDALRRSVWTQMLGLSDAHTNAQLYDQYQKELLPPSTPEFQALYDEIKRDAMRTQPDVSFFTAEKKDVVLRILYIYARLNPGIKYVQGMNELSAPLVYVLEDEAEAFWGFMSLMGQIKDTFMVDMDDDQACGVHAELNRLEHIIQLYDPDLLHHLKSNDLPTALYGLRWVTTWLAQDTHLLDCLRLWDSFLASRTMVLNACAAVMFMIRNELFACSDFSQLVTVLQEAPKGILSRNLDLFQSYAFALLAFKTRNQHGALRRFPPSPSESAAGEVVERLHEDFKHVKQAVARFAESEEVLSALHTVKASVASATEGASERTKTWLNDTQPQRQEALSAATETIGHLWGGVRSVAQKAAASETAKNGMNWLRSIVEEYDDEELFAPAAKQAYVEVDDDEECDWE